MKKNNIGRVGRIPSKAILKTISWNLSDISSFVFHNLIPHQICSGDNKNSCKIIRIQRKFSWKSKALWINPYNVAVAMLLLLTLEWKCFYIWDELNFHTATWQNNIPFHREHFNTKSWKLMYVMCSVLCSRVMNAVILVKVRQW